VNKLIAGGLALLLAAFALQITNFAIESATVDVAVQDDTFGPENTTVNAGDTVVWTWEGSNPHTVTSDTGGLFGSAQQTAGTFSFVFNTPGTYAYYCSVHGTAGGIGMSGAVTVQSAPTQTPDGASPTPDDDETPQATSTSASGSPTAVATVSANPTPIPEAMPIAAPATPAAGGGAPASQLPTSGAGEDDALGGAVPWLSAALAFAGVMALACAAYVRRLG
jgi:plastocyanin